jgi:aspartyl protease family protein
MLRIAILTAVGAIFIALSLPDLLSSFVSNGPIRPALAPAAPVMSHVATSAPAPADSGETFIDADRGGQYSTDVYIDGIGVKMLVDTGATMVVISYQTASRLGIQVLDSDYTGRVRTANGVAAVAPVTLREMTVGPIYLGDVKALVAARDAGAVDLLGMSFLKRLASVEQRSRRLALRQ